MADLDLTAAVETVAFNLARDVPATRHGQLCPVWAKKAALHTCDCWIVTNARRDATLAVTAAAPLIAGQVRQATADTIISAVEQRAVTWATSEGWITVRDVVAIARRDGDGNGTATT